MKRFYVNENLKVFVDLTQVNGINVLENTVDVIVNGDSNCRIVYDGNSHVDAAEFAEKLAAEVDADKESHLENFLNPFFFYIIKNKRIITIHFKSFRTI